MYDKRSRWSACALSSSNVITDSSGQLLQYCEYTPYGTLSRNEGTDVATHKFTGKELDRTGLYFYGARYYDPEIGRFITADTIVQAPYDPQSLNRYSYCRNNPINYTDPSGHSWFSKFFKAIGDFFSGIGKAIASNPGAFIAGLAVGIFTAWAIGPMISSFASACAASGSGITFGEGFLIGGMEMGIPAFTGTLAGGLAGGEKFGTALKNAAIIGGATFVTAGLIEGAYTNGWQNSVHFRDTQKVNELYHQAQSALKSGNLQAYADAANQLSKMGVSAPMGSSPLGIYRDPSAPLGIFADNPVIYTNQKMDFVNFGIGSFKENHGIFATLLSGEGFEGSSRIFVYGLKETMQPTSWLVQVYSEAGKDAWTEVSSHAWKSVTEDVARRLDITKEAMDYFSR